MYVIMSHKMVAPILQVTLSPGLAVRKQVATLGIPTWKTACRTCEQPPTKSQQKTSSQSSSLKEPNAANRPVSRETDPSPVEPAEDSAALGSILIAAL